MDKATPLEGASMRVVEIPKDLDREAFAEKALAFTSPGCGAATSGI